MFGRLIFIWFPFCMNLYFVKVYDQLLAGIYNTDETVDTTSGFLAFIDAPGGTGKTYTLNTLLNRIRGNDDIALASAFSGVAALLLKGGNLIFFICCITVFFYIILFLSVKVLQSINGSM